MYYFHTSKTYPSNGVVPIHRVTFLRHPFLASRVLYRLENCLRVRGHYVYRVILISLLTFFADFYSRQCFTQELEKIGKN